MATTKAPPAPTTRRPLNGLFLLTFFAISGLFTWLMRVDTVVNEVPTGFHTVVEDSRLENGTPLVTRYTGVTVIDEAAKFLVAAFIAGPARWDDGIREQQSYFLMHWFAPVCVWAIEAGRRRNKGRIVSFVALISFLYQLIGAAVIAPLYYLAYVFASASDAYYSEGREVSAGYAKSLLPAVVLGYLIPTAAMFYVPLSDITTVQNIIAFWQPAPIYVSVLLLVFSLFVPSSPSGSAANKNADVKHLKRVYLLVGLVAAVSHATTVYKLLTSDSAQLAFEYVFLPNRATWKDSMALGLHYIFQLDFFGAFGSTLIWCWLAVYDVLRILGKPSALDLIKTFLGIAFVTVVAGPGTAIVMVWNWREDRLVMIESGVRGTWKKPKAA
ncbi:hypothetical protein F5Y04DRAFT_31274 [Hypomontagnella monticulosa]|nr:hypothetical protein F5Y04DRAFT_31274 [Hypomontagnella monticulosa]